MKCTICENQTIMYEYTGAYECNFCLSFFSLSENFVGINLTNHISNNNYMIFHNSNIYIRRNGKTETYTFDSNIELKTDKEKYGFLKSFLDNIMFF